MQLVMNHVAKGWRRDSGISEASRRVMTYEMKME